jgi:hypothetical protein
MVAIMDQDISATPDELLALIEEMFPVQYDRAKAQLMIVKQSELIERLTRENKSLKSSVTDAAVEAHHGHSHDH